jgi:hypothetical protein
MTCAGSQVFSLIDRIAGVGRGDRQNIDAEPQIGPNPRSCLRQAPLHRLSRSPAKYGTAWMRNGAGRANRQQA